MNDNPIGLSAKEGIKAIEHSMRCFSFGLASLIPVIGFVLAFVAFSNFRSARAISRGQWNPGGLLLMRGILLATIGLAISSLIFVFVFAAVFQLLPGQYH
ncbi:MAG TPA: hypothetical protein VH413_08285 [Verrucomicrobiae bacterium]|jgi:TctA family transporter|nr:hypothetical protein [Verrucomicrobiae bacterium]